MADYRPRATVRTPWGDAGNLRERRLTPGPGRPASEVEQNQRERLYAATVACVAESGYEATNVADLLERSGVSRSAFYRHFRDKEDCLLGTFEAIAELGHELIAKEFAQAHSWEKRARGALTKMLAIIAHQPAAARLCLSEVGVAGPEVRAATEAQLSTFAKLTGEAFESLPSHPGLSDELARALLGGARAIIRSRLHGSEIDQLPRLADELWRWALLYEMPPEPLRSSGRRGKARAGAGGPPLAAFSSGERLIRALAAASAERGYAAVSTAEIAARASVAPATFNAHFANKEDALLAALDSTTTQMLAVAMPAIRRAPDWANGVRAGVGGLMAFGAAEPDLARLAAAGTYAASRRTVLQRAETMETLRDLLAPGYKLAQAQAPVPEVASEAIVGAVFSIAYEKIESAGPEALPEAAPLASYVALAPFLGAETAAKVANGDGTGPPIAA